MMRTASLVSPDLAVRVLEDLLSFLSVMVTRVSFCSPSAAPYFDLLFGVPRTSLNSSSSSWMESSNKVTTHGFSFSPASRHTSTHIKPQTNSVQMFTAWKKSYIDTVFIHSFVFGNQFIRDLDLENIPWNIGSLFYCKAPCSNEWINGFRDLLTWHEGDDGRISVGSLIVIHHDLGRSLASIAADSGFLADVTTAVHHGPHLPIRFIHLILCLFKLHSGNYQYRNTTQIITSEILFKY